MGKTRATLLSKAQETIRKSKSAKAEFELGARVAILAEYARVQELKLTITGQPVARGMSYEVRLEGAQLICLGEGSSVAKAVSAAYEQWYKWHTTSDPEKVLSLSGKTWEQRSASVGA